jgi:hypothetical protein
MIQFLDLASERPNNLRLHDRYVAMVKTTWANYGDGNPDLNGKYRRQFMDERRETSTSMRQAVHNPLDFELGSIRDAFEHGKEFYFERVVSKENQKAMKASLIRHDEKLARRGHPKFTSPFSHY